MTTTIIDARGQVCPMPMILTQKALKDPKASDPFVVLLNTDSARENVERFLQGQKRGYVVNHTGDDIKMTVSRTGPILPDLNAMDVSCQSSGGSGCC